MGGSASLIVHLPPSLCLLRYLSSPSLFTVIQAFSVIREMGFSRPRAREERGTWAVPRRGDKEVGSRAHGYLRNGDNRFASLGSQGER